MLTSFLSEHIPAFIKLIPEQKQKNAKIEPETRVKINEQHCQKFYIKQIPLGQFYSSHDVSFHQFEMKFPDSVMIANHLLF